MSEAALPATPPAPRNIGGFEIVQKVGQGGMGAVFKARQVSLDRMVALKILPPKIAKDTQFIDRFQREARATAKFNHPNIVQGIDVGQDTVSGLWYFAMEFIDGPSLHKVLKDRKVLPEEEALKYVRDIAKALECAASHNIVHRDIKPDNILLTTHGDAKLADLGLAKQISGEDSSMTQTGQTVGTPHYMAPEQARGEMSDIDIRADIYALGGTLYHLVTGTTPFSGQTAAIIMAKHLTEPPPLANKTNPAVSEACAKLIWKMMQKDRANRVQTPQELLTAIEKVLHKDTITGQRQAVRKGTTTGPRTPVGPINPVESKGSKKALLAVPAILLLGGVGFFAFSGKPEAPQPVVEANATGKEKKSVAKGGEETSDAAPEGDTPAATKKDRVSEANAFLAEIEALRKKTPNATADLTARYKTLIEMSKGTPAEKRLTDLANASIAQLQAEAIEAAWTKLKDNAQSALVKGDVDSAVKILSELPPETPDAIEERASAQASNYKADVDKAITAMLAEAERLSGQADPAGALKHIEGLTKIKYAARAEAIDAMKTRLEAEKADTVGLQHKRDALEADKKLADLLRRFDRALLEWNDRKDAKGIATEAANDTSLRSVENKAKAMGEILAAFDELDKTEKDAYAALIGRDAEVGTSKGKIVRVDAKSIDLEIKFGGGGNFARKNFKLADMTEDQRKPFVPTIVAKTDAQRVALAVSKLTKGQEDLIGAEALLITASEFPLSEHYANAASQKKVAVVEGAAEEEWKTFNALPAKITLEAAKKTAPLFDQYLKTFGATQFAAGKTKEIAAIRERLDTALNPAVNLVKNGSFENKLEGWETVGHTGEVSVQDGDAKEGKSNLHFFFGDQGRREAYQDLKVEPGTLYRVTAKLRLSKAVEQTECGFLMDVKEDEGNGLERFLQDGRRMGCVYRAANSVETAGEWFDLEFTFIPLKPLVQLRAGAISARGVAAGMNFDLDDVQVLRVPGAEGMPSDVKKFNGNTYKFYPFRATWAAAKLFCERQGGHLVTMTTKEESDFVQSMLEPQADGSSFHPWIGGFRKRDSDEFLWITEEPMAYKNWNRRNDDPPVDHFGYFRHSNWRSYAADRGPREPFRGTYGNMPFICEWEGKGGPADVAATRPVTPGAVPTQTKAVPAVPAAPPTQPAVATPTADKAIPVTLYYSSAETIDVYINGKPVKPGPGFKSRVDESRFEQSAEVTLHRGDLITIAGTRGNYNYGLLLVAMDKNNRVVWNTDGARWQNYTPTDEAKWYVPDIVMKSPMKPASTSIQASTWLTYKRMRDKYGKIDAIWHPRNQETAAYFVTRIP